MENILSRISGEIEKNNKIAMVIVTKLAKSSPGAPGLTMGVYEDGSIVGTVGGGELEAIVIEKALECLKKGESHLVEFNSGGKALEDKTEVFIKVYNKKPKLLLVGGGHVSYELYKLGVHVGFAVSIFEDREKFCSRERFPDADELILGNVVEGLRSYDIDDNCYVIMVSRGHIQDEEALKEVVSSNAKYIGMIGSRKKVQDIFGNLREKGVSDELLSKVYSPIGIAIGGKEVREIALGIIAEVVLVKNGGAPEHMKYLSK